MSSTLTAAVLTAAYSVRRTYKAHRMMMDTQGQYLSTLLISYGDISEDQAQLWISGKRRPPLPLVRHYADAASHCPGQLYDDVRAYYMTPAISRTQIMVLWSNLCEVLQTVPAADGDDIMATASVHDSTTDRTCMLLACLLQYAWYMDIARYTYVTA